MPAPAHPPAEAAARLRALTERWHGVDANERASFQTWFLQFCDALGAPSPAVPTDDYRFELPVKVVDRDGELATNFVDAWRAGHFAIEAKMSDPARNNDALLRKAFGQVRTYVAHVSGTPPPYLMVVDVPRTLILWDRWSGSYGDFGAGRRIALGTLHERADDIALLQDVFARPEVRDPRGRAQAVTKEIASRLAALAAALEDRGLDQERVARFLMRCVFSCFAEDVGLLPEQLFRKTLEAARGSGDPLRLKAALELLWKTMDEGGMFGAEMLHRFNGHFFKTREALPLEAADVALLVEATAYDWSRVEPSIFGTLLVRALDPAERHRLGAEYTPREYIERLVEPTVVEPIRERWVAVQASVVQLEESGKRKDREAAVKALRDFHGWLRSLRFLDPACGSGNFLYVTMAAVKRVEHEVLNELQRLAGGQGGLVLEEVHPRQFFGIEIKPWAREIAELTLWIGYHQFWRETHGGRTPPDPILEDTGTIECRDAILAYDDVVHRPEKDRPDPTPRIRHPVTGELVPDPAAKLPYYEYVNARPAEWPEAEFIVGNPPYLGKSRKRAALGNGYVDAIQDVYREVPDSSDFVMIWWYRAAQACRESNSVRAGLITTNSIVQKQNRTVVARARANGVHISWACPDHPWADSVTDAAVRVAMTVMRASEDHASTLVTVNDDATIVGVRSVLRLNDDLSVGADVVGATSAPLLASKGLATVGAKLYGEGFVLDALEAERLLALDNAHRDVIRPYVIARELVRRPEGNSVIDFGSMELEEAKRFPVILQIVRDRVLPHRAVNPNADISSRWWQHGHLREQLRTANQGLTRFIATPETSRHRPFMFLEQHVLAEGSVFCICVDDGFLLGVLSSFLHISWASASAGRLGVGNDYRYNKGCFDPFPFPDPSPDLRARIADLAERLDTHRKAALARDKRVTMTGMYNVVEKLRAGTALTPKERAIHEAAACGILRDLHDDLDRLVAEAYGWPWPMERGEILERLVALHDERVEEEKRGLIRWLRPDYQIPRFAPEQAGESLALEEAPAAPRGGRGRKTRTAEPAAPFPAKAPWPATAVEQIAAIGALLAQRPLDPAAVAASFTGAKPDLVQRHLDTLTLMGEVVVGPDGKHRSVRRAA